MGKGRRAGITLAIPWDERFRGARVTLPAGGGGEGGGSGGEGGLGGSLVGLFTPRLAARRSQRNRWQRATSLPDDVRDGARFFLRGGISGRGWKGLEPPERIITKRMLEQVWEGSVFQYELRENLQFRLRQPRRKHRFLIYERYLKRSDGKSDWKDAKFRRWNKIINNCKL